MSKSNYKESKHRYFCFLLYPDSAPADWELKLEAIGQPIAVSPWHDKDKVEQIDPETGQKKIGFKKKHAHCIYVASNPVTASSVRKKLQRALKKNEAVAMVQVCDNIEGAYLYLTHESKDAIAKKKHVYDKSEIRHLNNFDIERYITLDVEQKKEILNVVISIVRSYKLCNIFDLYDFVEVEGESYGLKLNDITEVVKSNSGFMRLLFDGAYQRSQFENKKSE